MLYMLYILPRYSVYNLIPSSTINIGYSYSPKYTHHISKNTQYPLDPTALRKSISSGSFGSITATSDGSVTPPPVIESSPFSVSVGYETWLNLTKLTSSGLSRS